MKIIQQTGFGTATVEIALVLRESLLINGMMTNSEIWHNITASEIEEFERVDRLFFQQLMGVPQSVPKPVLFLEFGSLPLNYLVKARRLNYLYNLLNSPNTSMLFKVFSVQWHYPSKGDWTLLVKDDLRDFELSCDLQKLKLMSKENFKKTIKERAKLCAYRDLVSKKETYSKLRNLEYDELKIQEYLINSEFSHEEKKMIFQYRTRMAKFEDNFKAGRLTTLCPLCSAHSDSQFMILQCPIIYAELQKNMGITLIESIEDIFTSNISRNTVNILKATKEIRSCKVNQ